MKNCERHAFTLVELLVVIAVIALLVMLFIPTFTNVQEYTRATTCKKNLKEMADGINSAPDRRPYPPEWRRFLRGRGIGGVLTCPSDPDADAAGDPEDFPDDEDVYLVQKQGNDVRFSNMQVILDEGLSPEDAQVSVTDSAHGIQATENQDLVKIGSECALIRVTRGSVIKFESLIVPTTHTGHMSIHWLCVDDGMAGWFERVEAELAGAQASEEANLDPSVFVMRLQGGDKYTRKWPDIALESRKASYAMSDAVDNLGPRPGQLMLVEYSKDVAKVFKQGFSTDRFGSSNADERGFLRTRHFDMANFVTTDGSVRSMTREQLQEEYDAYTIVNRRGLWAP